MKRIFIKQGINQKIESNVELNVEHNENGHLVGARKLLNLKVGTAGFEPTASCTPSKSIHFPSSSLLIIPQ